MVSQNGTYSYSIHVNALKCSGAREQLQSESEQEHLHDNAAIVPKCLPRKTRTQNKENATVVLPPLKTPQCEGNNTNSNCPGVVFCENAGSGDAITELLNNIDRSLRVIVSKVKEDKEKDMEQMEWREIACILDGTFKWIIVFISCIVTTVILAKCLKIV